MASSQLGLAATLLVLAGCAAEEAFDVQADDDADTKRVAFGVVAVERTEGEGLSRASVSAKFMRVSAKEQILAEDLVASRAVIPAAGECATLASLDDLSVARFSSRDWQSVSGFAVELLDVGDVSLLLRPTNEAGAAQKDSLLVPLSPRAFPDVGDLASGVFYTTPDATLPLSSVPFELSGSGAPTLDAFVLDAGAIPEHPAELRVAGLVAEEEDVIEVAADADVSLSWTRASTNEAGSEAVVYVDILGTSAYRCAFADAGAAVLPRGILGESDVGGEATISVHRVSERVVPLKQADQAAGEARIHFDVASAVRVTVLASGLLGSRQQ
ncbi:MAG: hypothetical protein HOV80_20315 [Polyangiaceae bacterium]|nr:hypothetical protein [Polyangiaceae bacterium]